MWPPRPGTHHFPQVVMQLVDDDTQPRQLADHAAQLLAGALAHARPLLCALAHMPGDDGDRRAEVQGVRVFTDGVGFG